MNAGYTFFFFFLGGAPLGWGGIGLGRFARMAIVGKSAGYELDLPADFPTKVS